MHVSHRAPIAAFLLTALVYSAATSLAAADGLSGLTPADEFRGSIANVRGVLAPHRTFVDMTGFVGAHPRRCVTASRSGSICVWPLGKREEVWRPLAEALNTGDRLNLICEFPANDAPRAEDSCSVHSQRSNRRYYKLQVRVRSGGGAGRTRAALAADAQKMLAGAQTAFALSTLVGDAPTECLSSASRVFCTWKTNSATYGHGTLAMSARLDHRKKVRMSCVFPADGSPRAPDACAVNIGG